MSLRPAGEAAYDVSPAAVTERWWDCFRNTDGLQRWQQEEWEANERKKVILADRAAVWRAACLACAQWSRERGDHPQSELVSGRFAAIALAERFEAMADTPPTEDRQ